MKKSNPVALLPILVFLILYLGLGILFEYVLQIPMGFYNIPIIVAFLAAILVSAMCALIRAYGGFDALLQAIHHVFKGKKSGQLGVGLLVGTMDIATANNTVAIVMTNPIAKEMAVTYDITPRKTASLLDTFSCIFQGIIPYGAQMLVAISAVHELGTTVSAFDILPYLYYPYFLLLSSLVWFFVIPSGKNVKRQAENGGKQ